MRWVMVVSTLVVLTDVMVAQPPEAASERWVEVFRAKPSGAVSLAFSTDGGVLAHSGYTVQAWDTKNGKERPLKVAQTKWLGKLNFSPAGDLFAIQRPLRWGRSVLREVSTGEEFAGLKGSGFSVLDVAFSPDGKIIAVTGTREMTNPPRGRLRLFDAASKKELFDVACEVHSSRLLAFMPDGKTVAVSGTDKVVAFWDIKTQKELRRSPAIEGYMFALARGGRAVLASGANGEAALFDLENGKRLATFSLGKDVEMRFRAVTADGSRWLAAGYEDPHHYPRFVIRWWDLTTGKPLGTFRPRNLDWTHLFAVSADGRQLALSSVTELTLWKLER